MNKIELYPIGKIKNEENEVKIVIDAKYRKGLIGLEGYSHVQDNLSIYDSRSRIDPVR